MAKKTGQTALVLVIVTMVTVLGIGVASSTQSNVNLRNTVYSTQTEQALACAEAGIEIAIGMLNDNDPTNDNSMSGPVQLGNCSYFYEVDSYPTSTPGQIIIPKLLSNATQELKYSNGSTADLPVDLNIIEEKASPSLLSVNMYGDNDTIIRRLYCFGDSSSCDSNMIQVSTTNSNASFTINNVSSDVKIIRIRPINADIDITISNYPNETAKVIRSEGNAGQVRRVIEARKFEGQLSSMFDDAVVNFQVIN